VLEDLAVLVQVEVRHRVDVRGRPRAARGPRRVPRDDDLLAGPVVAELERHVDVLDHDAAEHADEAEELLVALETARLDARRVRELDVGRVDVPLELAVRERGHVRAERVDGRAEVELELGRRLPPVGVDRRGQVHDVVRRAQGLQRDLLVLGVLGHGVEADRGVRGRGVEANRRVRRARRDGVSTKP